MTPQFINISNRPSSKWSSKQLNAAKELAANQFNCKPEDVVIVDLPFPNVSPHDSATTIRRAATEQAATFEELSITNPIIIHIMGEITYVHNFVLYAINAGIRCYASTTESVLTENADSLKTSTFIQFRPY